MESRWLVFHVEINTTRTDPASLAAVIESIENQVSSLMQSARVNPIDPATRVDYQVTSMHGQERDT